MSFIYICEYLPLLLHVCVCVCACLFVLITCHNHSRETWALISIVLIKPGITDN